jgi:hypothetical protein
MKCVYSFWSKPFLANIPSGLPSASGNTASHSYAGFASFEDFLYSWVLSVELSAQHYPDLELVTDTYGNSLLVEQLKLPFTSVTTVLDRVPEHVSSKHWSLSKIVAYAFQTEPFVHVDADVFLWKRLPHRIEDAPIFGQNTDSQIWLNYHYTEPYFLMYKFLQVLPDGFTYEPRIFHQWDTAICCGIVGGQNWQLIKGVGVKGVEVFYSEKNKPGWQIALSFDSLWGDRVPSYGCISVIEQYGLAKECWLQNIWHDVRFLLDEKKISTDMQYLKKVCAELGYTHLIDWTKKLPDNRARLKRRITADYERHLGIIADLVRNERLHGARQIGATW